METCKHRVVGQDWDPPPHSSPSLRWEWPVLIKALVVTVLQLSRMTVCCPHGRTTGELSNMTCRGSGFCRRSCISSSSFIQSLHGLCGGFRVFLEYWFSTWFSLTWSRSVLMWTWSELQSPVWVCLCAPDLEACRPKVLLLGDQMFTEGVTGEFLFQVSVSCLLLTLSLVTAPLPCRSCPPGIRPITAQRDLWATF